MSWGERVASFFRSEETKEKEDLTTAQKVNRMFEILDLPAPGGGATDHGPFALVPVFDSLVVVDDTSEAFDRWEMQRQIDELKKQEQFKDLHAIRLTPRDFLAYISTGGSYVGFHDKMGFAIMLGEFRSGWGDTPNYGRIDKVLKKSGFENIEESRLSTR